MSSEDRTGWQRVLRLNPVVDEVVARLQTPSATVLTPAEEAENGRIGSGVERPEDLDPSAVNRQLIRTFAFVDIGGFTSFTDTNGEQAAVDLLAGFRNVLATVAARRGVRIAKYLGDGAMLVGVTAGPVVATVAEICGRFAPSDLTVRAGIARGPVILFGGDDYIGRAVNLASRLCDAADSDNVLATADVAETAPEWVRCTRVRNIDIRGVGRVRGVTSLCLDPSVELPDNIAGGPR